MHINPILDVEFVVILNLEGKKVGQFDIPADYPRTSYVNSPEPPPSHPFFKPRQTRKLFAYKQNYTSMKQAVMFAIYNIQKKVGNQGKV